MSKISLKVVAEFHSLGEIYTSSKFQINLGELKGFFWKNVEKS